MNMLNRALAFLASRGMRLPAQFRVTKHQTKTTRLAGQRSKCRLQIARGPGSISAKSDCLQLARAGKFLMAYDVALQHKQQCGEQLFPDEVLDAWMMEGKV